MNMMSSGQAPPLLDMLGGRWRVQVSANAVAWDRTGAFAGFALDDGTLALVPAAWDGCPDVRPRPGGGAELVPATAPAPPVARAGAHRGRCLSVAADPDSGFLSGGADGRVVRVGTDGTMGAVGHMDGAVITLATSRPAWRVCAAGRSVQRLGGTNVRIDVAGSVASLAVEPNGARVAIGHAGGVSLWAGGATPQTIDLPADGLVWSADGAWLAARSAGNGLGAWPGHGAAPIALPTDGPVHALVPAAGAFAVGIGGRVFLWHPATGELVPCGVANQTAVTRLAGHPRRTLIAAGYANGTVVLCQPGTTQLLFVRSAGNGAVSALQFSPSGGTLAIGTQDGDIGVTAVPDALFRDSPRVQ